LLPNDLTIIMNQGVDHGGHVGPQEGAVEPSEHAQQVANQSNSELWSLTFSPTRSPVLSCLQIGAHDVSDL
jgi:hypothetical protein